MLNVTNDPILRIQNISVVFDDFHALTDVKADVQRHSIHFFIGPNGAGKSTLMDIICGKTKPSQGNVTFYPKDNDPIRLTGLKEYKIAQLGVGRKFQTPSVFVNLTVEENMMLALKGHKDILGCLFYRMTPEEAQSVDEMLRLVDLDSFKNQKAGSLAHGQKQWLEIAMQLVQKPDLIMLDEPAAGMGKTETYKTGQILKEIKKAYSVIVIEHDMEFVKQCADAVTVLHEGRVLMEGTVDEVLENETVQAVYLGRGGEHNAGN